MNWLRRAVATAGAAVLLVGCGGKGAAQRPPTEAETPAPAANQGAGPREVDITLDGHHGPENVGILMAEKRGYFADRNLRPVVTTAAEPTSVVSYVTSKTVEFGVSTQPQLVLEAEQGKPIVAVGSLISQPTASMIWLKGAGIQGIADLKGKTIAIPGLRFQRMLLDELLESAGLSLRDVRVKKVGYKLASALLHQRADATFGGSGNLEGPLLRARGTRPVVIPARRFGIPPYEEQVLFARADEVAKNPRYVRSVMAAVRLGTAAAIAHPGEAVDLIEKDEESDPGAGREATEAELQATLPLLSRSGYMNPRQAQSLVSWMHDRGFIQHEPPVPSLLTNAYLESPP